MPLDTRVIKAVGNLGSLGNARVEQPLPQVMRVFPSSYSLLDFYQRAALALRWSLGDFSPPLSHLAHGSIWRPERHGFIGNRGH